jgi:predicted PolB exonuclease-like 3'-5' exonuclease
MRTTIVVDIETRIDKSLVNATRYHHEGLTDDEAYQRYRAELKAERGSDFLPVIYHVPISIGVGKVEDCVIKDVWTLGKIKKWVSVDDFDEAWMVCEFWELVNQGHALVTFNGRGFDLPVLELAALRYGIQSPRYWVAGTKGHRYRYSDELHYDVADVLCNTGATPRSHLNDLLVMLGFGGKGNVDGSKVQQMWEDGKIREIHEYCRKDVISTYALWLRLELIRGRLTHDQYEDVFAAAAPWLKQIR